jgi:hypothetical protein
MPVDQPSKGSKVMGNEDDSPLTEAQITARREAGLKKLLATPPKPHKPKKEKGDQSAPKRNKRVRSDPNRG